MIKIKTLLSSVLALIFSAIAMAADFNSHAEIQKKTPTPFVEAALASPNGQTECRPIISDSTATAWNTGEICFVSDIETSTAGSSVAADLRVAGLMISQDIFGDSDTGAECISAGGSMAVTEDTTGFCMASDLNNAQEDVANFSVKNGLPVAGMQFLQATFSDGSTQSASAPLTSECISAGGTTTFTANAEGFCLVSDISRSITDFARFSVANALPVTALQFLQVKLNTGLSGASGAGTKCLSVGGSTAAARTGGFCLASDLSTSAAAFTNFSVAHNASATDLQFLQISFGDSGLSAEPISFRGAGAPIGVECISSEGSISATGNLEGFCLVSDLISPLIGSANITIANDSPVTGLQFLQATFGGDGSLASSSAGTECVSPDGSTAASGKAGGFCLVSDLFSNTVGSANFSVANDLPVMSWEFIQVPSEAGSPVGVVVSDSVEVPFDLRSASFLTKVVGSRTPFFHLSDQTIDMEEFSTPYWRIYPHLGLWVGR